MQKLRQHVVHAQSGHALPCKSHDTRVQAQKAMPLLLLAKEEQRKTAYGARWLEVRTCSR